MQAMSAPSRVAAARSFLFVPADRPDRLAKALAGAADMVIADLEDALGPGAKDAGRAALAAAWAQLGPDQRARLMVRINPPPGPLHEADMACVAAMAREGLAALMLPKAENAAAVAAVAAACPGLALVPLIESAQAFGALDAIASAPQVVRLAFGHLDLQADLGKQAGADQAELTPARWAVALASRRANLAQPVDGVTTDLAATDRLVQDVQRGLRLGFSAKLCIHPSQVAVVHATLSPSPAEQEWAQRVLAATEAAGGGVVQLDGRMVDAPVIRLATQILARTRS